MVHTITPVVDGRKRPRSLYGASVVLHTLGATTSAALFGGLLGTAGMLARAPWGPAGTGVVAFIAALYAARELARLPIPLFDRRRQVPEWWRTFYSRPVAALLYGLSLGIGFLTFLTFGSFVVVCVVALASGSPAAGAALCGSFGLARGLAVLTGAGSSAGAWIESASSRRAARLANGGALVGVALLAVAAIWS
jgi:type IV secretory pathway TrbD component